MRKPPNTGKCIFALVAKSVLSAGLPSASFPFCSSFNVHIGSPYRFKRGELPEHFRQTLPLAGIFPLTDRQAESFKCQATRRKTGGSRGSATLHLRPMSETKGDRDLGPGGLLVTFRPHEK